tara:strand:+ start:89 stop:625 length:537 start_codon:yes stop_codon:yes gene_type:complete
MAYFTKFPKMLYDLQNNSEFKLVPDIFRRIKVRNKIKDNISLIDKYDVSEGETPETVAFKIYGDTNYFWVVCLMNNIVNRYYDWPLNEFAFQRYIEDKYSNPDGIHHYEKLQSSGKQTGDGPADYSHMIECNETDTGAQSVSNREYERRLQDQKRQIKILAPGFLSVFEEEFDNLVRR